MRIGWTVVFKNRRNHARVANGKLPSRLWGRARPRSPVGERTLWQTGLGVVVLRSPAWFLGLMGNLTEPGVAIKFLPLAISAF